MAFPASERGVAAAKPQTTAACLPPAVAGALHLFVSKAVYPALCGGFLVLLLPGRGLFHHDASLTRLAIVLFMVSAAVMYHLAIRSDGLLRRLEGRPDARASKGSSARRSVISWNSPPSTTGAGAGALAVQRSRGNFGAVEVFDNAKSADLARRYPDLWSPGAAALQKRSGATTTAQGSKPAQRLPSTLHTPALADLSKLSAADVCFQYHQLRRRRTASGVPGADGTTGGVFRLEEPNDGMVRRASFNISSCESIRSETEILYCEDDLLQRVAVRQLLKKHYKFVSTSSGEQTLQVLAERYAEGGNARLPDVILMDHNLPGISGMETVRIIRSLYASANMAVVMLTSSDSDELFEGSEQPFLQHLMKPVKRAMLLECVRTQEKICRNSGEIERSEKSESMLQPVRSTSTGGLPPLEESKSVISTLVEEAG